MYIINNSLLNDVFLISFLFSSGHITLIQSSFLINLDDIDPISDAFPLYCPFNKIYAIQPILNRMLKSVYYTVDDITLDLRYMKVCYMIVKH